MITITNTVCIVACIHLIMYVVWGSSKHTHTIILLLFWNLSGTTRISRYQKGKNQEGKTNLDLLKREIVSGSGICWVIWNAYSLRPPARSPPPCGQHMGSPHPHSTHPQSSSLHGAVKAGSKQDQIYAVVIKSPTTQKTYIGNNSVQHSTIWVWNLDIQQKDQKQTAGIWDVLLPKDPT